MPTETPTDGAVTEPRDRGATRDTTRDTTGDTTRDTTRDVTRDATRDATGDTTGDATRDAAATRDTTGDTTRGATRDTTRDAPVDAAVTISHVTKLRVQWILDAMREETATLIDKLTLTMTYLVLTPIPNRKLRR